MNIKNLSDSVEDAINILIVDDDEDDFFIIGEYIHGISSGQKFKINWCPEYDNAMQKFCSGNYHICFVDYRLGAKTGLDFITEATQNLCEEPFILLTGTGNLEIDKRATDAGAVDYLIKSELNSEKLERSIRYALGRHNFIQALKANEQKFRNIFEGSKDAIFITDEDFNLKDVNDAASELLLFSREEFLNSSLYTLFADQKLVSYLKSLLVLKGEAKDFEVEFQTRNKEKVVGVLSITKYRNIDAQIFFHGIIHDITSLRKAEKTNLQTEKLRATGRLIQTLAHEVRNPLNNINLSVEQLTHYVKDDDTKTYLEIIERNSKRIGTLITELLASSRPSESPLIKISLQSVLEKSISSAHDRIKLKKIKLKKNYATKEVFIMADAEKLSIAFLNIIINAVEAMEEDKGELTITIEDNKMYNKVLIHDNGSGISEENLSKLFEPYFTSKRNGMGLGLASVLNILQSHKALVDVESKAGEGTTFILSFQKAA